jgi:hypothetical protein
MITYSVFSLERTAFFAWRRGAQTGPFGIPLLESAPVSEKPLPRPPGLWGLNAVPPFADAHSGRSAGQLAGIGCTKRAFERSTKLEFDC